MTVDRRLAWLALVVGVAGLIPAFKEAGWLWASPLIAILLGISGYLVYSEWSSTRTAVTVLSLEKRVVIADKGGQTADLIRTQRIRVNQGWLHDYWFRNMVADGSFGPITIDDAAPAQTSRLGCLVSFAINFPAPIAKGKTREIVLKCQAFNSFTAKEEGLLHEVAQDTRQLTLKVELPADRICKECGLRVEAAGEPNVELEAPEISADRRIITAVVKRPRTGFTHHLHWIW